MTIGLAMIVRDAEQTLPRLLASLGGVGDPERSTIIDTGSTDATTDVIEAWGAKPHRREWRNFAHNRTELMQLARGKADHLFLLDADLELDWRGALPELTADIALAPLHQGDLIYQLPFLVRGDKAWEYRGYAHSYLAAVDGHATRQTLQAFVAKDRGRVTEEKLRRDVVLLKAELAEHPGDARATFYLAQTYRDLGQHEDAIACYRRRAEMGGFDEECWYALYQAGVLLVEHRSYARGAPLLLEAYRQRPHRAEPLRALGNSSHSVADKLPYPADDVLFISASAYEKSR